MSVKKRAYKSYFNLVLLRYQDFSTNKHIYKYQKHKRNMPKKMIKKEEKTITVNVKGMPMNEVSGYSVTGVVIGGINVFLFWIPYFGIVLGAISLTFSIVGFKRSIKKNWSIMAIILSIFEILGGLLITISLLS